MASEAGISGAEGGEGEGGTGRGRRVDRDSASS